MRTTSDRILHAISFEVIGLALVVPLGALVFGLGLHEVGVIGLASSLIATVWTYFYNLWFDRALRRLTGKIDKSLVMRMLHAVFFELGLLVLFAPLIALYLGISLWHALTIDISLALFYMGYAFVFNWIYDLVFPIPVE